MSFIPNSYPIGVMICYNDLIYRLITVLGGVPVQTAFYFSFLFLNFPLIHILVRYHPVRWILPDGMRLLYWECLSLRPIKQIALWRI